MEFVRPFRIIIAFLLSEAGWPDINRGGHAHREAAFYFANIRFWPLLFVELIVPAVVVIPQPTSLRPAVRNRKSAFCVLYPALGPPMERRMEHNVALILVWFALQMTLGPRGKMHPFWNVGSARDQASSFTAIQTWSRNMVEGRFCSAGMASSNRRF
jgi:hypothetical protein